MAALIADQSDVRCAVIASNNVSVRQRNAEMMWETDITGFSDFVDPIDLGERTAKSAPRRVIVLTDRRTRLSRPRANRHTWRLLERLALLLTTGF